MNYCPRCWTGSILGCRCLAGQLYNHYCHHSLFLLYPHPPAMLEGWVHLKILLLSLGFVVEDFSLNNLLGLFYIGTVARVTISIHGIDASASSTASSSSPVSSSTCPATSIAQPSECGRQHTLISVHAQTAAWQQSNGNSEARMSEKCGEWRD